MAHHLRLEERDRIAQLRHAGAAPKEIANALGRSRATISRELRRNRVGENYYAAQAQREAQRRRRERPLARKMDDPQINQQVREGLAQEWSPEQIAGRLQQHADDEARTVSPQTIYAWIRRDPRREHWESLLRRRGKRPGRRKEATCRAKNADHVHHKLKQRLKKLHSERRRSITFDNGTEFARCHRLEKHLGLKLYFADPGCPYQRGTNENTNGLIRQYFPKGTDFRDISHSEVRRVEKLLNTRPRACLGFRTPNVVSFEKDPPSGCD